MVVVSGEVLTNEKLEDALLNVVAEVDFDQYTTLLVQMDEQPDEYRKYMNILMAIFKDRITP